MDKLRAFAAMSGDLEQVEADAADPIDSTALENSEPTKGTPDHMDDGKLVNI